MALYLQHREDGIQWAVWKMEEPLDVLLSLLPNTRKISYEKELPRFTCERRKMEWLSVRVSDHSFYISISHTKGYVAVALSSLNSVGIDIEQYGQRVHRVSDRYIRPDEQVESYQEDLTWGLLLYWSAKETIFKRMENADADFRKLRLAHFIPQVEGTFQVQEFATQQQKLYTVGYRIEPDFVLTWTEN